MCDLVGQDVRARADVAVVIYDCGVPDGGAALNDRASPTILVCSASTLRIMWNPPPLSMGVVRMEVFSLSLFVLGMLF